MKKYFALFLAALLLLLAAGCAADGDAEETTIPVQADMTDDNYRVFYEIFVGSFSDSDGDGVGDLRGIINRMDYLNNGDVNNEDSLGVQGLWLSPIFQSSSYHKYDADSYYQIDTSLGTEEDLKELVTLCHERNVKMILDLAINHTSSQSAWFTAFCEAHASGDTGNAYYDYYSWSTGDERNANATYALIPGCEDEYYECNFSQDMPELNYDNEGVRKEVLAVGEYWLDLGVDGFRFDAIKYIYYGETARNVEFWQWYTDELRKGKPDAYFVGECWSGEGEVLEYYPALNCFNFGASQAEGVISLAAKGGNINNYTAYICNLQNKIAAKNADGMMINFISNHDMDRAAGYLQLANHYAEMGANLYLLGPGSPFLYYGEEIGLKGTRGSADTDANRRLAMLWGDDDTVSDPVGATYEASKQTNGTVSLQLEQEDSLLHYYSRLITLRIRYPEIARGTYTALDFGDSHCGGFSVTYGDSVIGIVHNVDDEEQTLDLAAAGVSFTELCEAIGQGSATLDGTMLTVGAQTSVILK